MSRYKYPDDRIVSWIARGANTTAALHDNNEVKNSLEYHKNSPWESVLRVLNRRLQALRKRGVIRFDTEERVWRVV